MPDSVILTCTCKNEAQNNLYGKGRRVFNFAPKAKGGNFRCTVCGAIKFASAGSKSAEEELEKE